MSEDKIRFSCEHVGAHGSVARLWKSLEQQKGSSFFVSWTWIGNWLCCLPAQIRPLLLTATRRGEKVAAAILVPCGERRLGVVKVRQLHFNSTGDAALDCVTIEHNGFVGSAGALPSIWPDFLRWFALDGAADELVVPGLTQSVLNCLPQDARLLHRNTSIPGFCRELPHGGMEPILAGFGSNTRQQLRRNLRGWAQLGEPRLETAASVDVALTWFDHMKQLHIRYWTGRGRRHAFHHPFWEKFHRALIAAGADNGCVRMRRVSAGTHLLGYLYDFRWEGRVYAYQSGFAPGHPDLRPGYVAHTLAMEQDARQGARAYDFLAGDNRLKQNLGERTYTLGCHRYARRTLALQAEAAAAWAARRLQSVRNRSAGPQGGNS